MDFPPGSVSKESACCAGDLGLSPGLGRFPWRRTWQSTLAFLPGESPRTEEPGGFQSMGSQRVRHDWATEHSKTMVRYTFKFHTAEIELFWRGEKETERYIVKSPLKELKFGNIVAFHWQSFCQARWGNVFSFWAVLSSKVHLVKAMVFPVVMYGCESWTIKKAERWRTDGFELWCWRKLLRAPWTARRSNQSILKEISPEYSLEGLTLRLKLQYFGHLKNWLIWKDPDAGKDWKWEENGDNRGWYGWMASPTQWTWVWANSGSWWWTGRPGVLQSMGSQRVGHDRASELDTTERLNWTDHHRVWELPLLVSCLFQWGVLVFHC